MIDLTSRKVTLERPEQAAQELFNELFKLELTGDNQADLFFNQAQLPKEAPLPQIHTVWIDLRPREENVDPTQKRICVEADIMIYLRVANQGGAGMKNDFRCRELADKVRQIFQSPDRFALARRGIYRARIVRGPVPVATIGYQVRAIVLHCELRYLMSRS
jgi:hypothetical protein